MVKEICELIAGNMDSLFSRLIAANFILYIVIAVSARWRPARILRESIFLAACFTIGHLADLIFGLYVKGDQGATDPTRNAALTLWLARGILRYAVPLLSERRGRVGFASRKFLLRVDMSLMPKDWSNTDK